MSKIEKYKRKLEENEAKKREKAKLFSIDEILADSAKIYEAYVPELNAIVKYGKITIGDLEEIAKGKTDEEKAIRILWKMLQKADRDITLEKVKQLPLEVAAAILTRIAGPLFQTQQQSTNG